MSTKLSQFILSVRHALHGVKTVFIEERNFRIQTTAALVALALGVIFKIETWEFILVLLLSSAILCLELTNSALERLANGLSPRLRPLIGDVKDIMAGTVLLASLLALAIGFIIFLPHIPV
ncbi:MAG: diacylglycerol kinase family protein [Patescibacteria group bacterium]